MANFFSKELGLTLSRCFHNSRYIILTWQNSCRNVAIFYNSAQAFNDSAGVCPSFYSYRQCSISDISTFAFTKQIELGFFGINFMVYRVRIFMYIFSEI